VTEFETPERTPQERGTVPAAPVRIQRKLVVGAASDPLEVEADRMADEVMRVLQRSTSADVGPFAASQPTRIARHAAHDHDRAPEVGRDGGAISGELATRIRSASGGAPLAPRTLARMESGFGASFGDVRVHANSPLPAEVAADAFTTGTDVHFAPGLYAPSSSAGEHLLAHELTHVVQQGGSGVARHVCDSACGHLPQPAWTRTPKIARHACGSSCRHDVGVERGGHLVGLDVDALLRRSLVEEITPADTGYAIRRHSSWEHMLIGDLDPKSLATLGAAQNTKNLGPNATVNVGTDVNDHPIDVSKDDVKHVIQQEIDRLKRFQDRPPMFRDVRQMRQTEQILKDRDARQRIHKAGGDDEAMATEQNKEWDLKLVALPNVHGQAFLVTYGELNTIGDYFGSVEEMKQVDHTWMSKLIRGVRQSTMHELIDVYTDISGFQDSKDVVGIVTKEKGQKARDELGITSEDFRAADGSKDLVSLGGIANELKLMGFSQQTKPQVGGEEATNYASTLARNACHFAPESWHAWFNLHTKAREFAGLAYQLRSDAVMLNLQLSDHRIPDTRKAALKEEQAQLRARADGLENEALLHNGFGDHYLQDSYAAGHLINKTLIMQQYVQWLDKNRFKWDAYLDSTWRVMQQMAYNQPGMAAPTQHAKADIGKRTLSSGLEVETGRNPQTVENIQTKDWRDRAEALGLRAPSSVRDPDAKAVLLLWQTKCVTRWKVRKTREQTFKTLRLWDNSELHLGDDRLMAALNALFSDGIIRMGSYGTKDRITQHVLKSGTDLVLRDEYVPSNSQKVRDLDSDPDLMEDMALGVAYNDYLEFMNSAFLQKATNFVHDKFCLEGLVVKAGNNDEVFRIYGDDSMFKANAGPGLLHSGTTAHMSRNAITDIAWGRPTPAARTILDRLPASVQLDDSSIVPLETWHHGELLTKLENGIFDSMSNAGMTQIKNKGVGLKPTGIGKITGNDRPGGHEVF
jgi:hypothetical protein